MASGPHFITMTGSVMSGAIPIRVFTPFRPNIPKARGKARLGMATEVDRSVPLRVNDVRPGLSMPGEEPFGQQQRADPQ